MEKMKHLIMICNLESMCEGDLSTSSSRYELKFAQELSKRVQRVSVVSPKAEGNCCKGNISLYGCASGNLMYDIKPVIEVAKKLIIKNEETVIFFWGYNPILIHLLCGLKSPHTKVASMVYDTHLGELSGKGFLKKNLIKFFYMLGIVQINRLNAVLLFKSKAIEHLRIRTKACVILPGVDINSIEKFVDVQDKKLTFLYSGTLCEYNGIKELLAAFISIENKNISLKIYGDGPLTQEVQEATTRDSRILYGGRISNRELKEEIERADVLLNLRQVPSIVNDIAFPSKVTEYMSAGKVVMSTRVSEYKEFDEAVYLLRDLKESTIASCIEYISAHGEEFQDKVRKSKQYLEMYHDNNIIFSKLYKFLFEELF